MVVPPKHTNWFTYFPEDYRWSSAMVGTLSTAPFGGADIGEVDRVGRRLRDHVGDDEAWFSEWRTMGDVVRTLGEQSQGRNHRFTAAAAYL